MFYEAEYQPRQPEKISEKAKKFIGTIIAVQDGGQEEIAPGKNQVVYIASPSFGLIPNTDLKDIQSIPYSRWVNLSETNTEIIKE